MFLSSNKWEEDVGLDNLDLYVVNYRIWVGLEC